MIKLTNINIAYDTVLIKQGEMTIHDQSITAIIGKSGLGKTTLLNHIAFISPYWFNHLDYYLDGMQLKYKNRKDILRIYREKYFYIFQKENMIEELSCKDNLLFLCDLYQVSCNNEKIKDISKRLEIDFDLDQYPNTISGGQRQKLELAMVLLIQPQIILCDEITSSLDQESSFIVFSHLRDIIQEIGSICIIVTHDDHITELCDYVYLLENKKIKLIKQARAMFEIKQKRNKIEHHWGLNYLMYKLHNKVLVKQYVFGSILFAILFTLLNLLVVYNLNTRSLIQSSLADTVNCEMVFNDTLITDLGTPYYTFPSIIDIEHRKINVNVHVGKISNEISKHLITYKNQSGVIISESLAQELSGEEKIIFTIEENEYRESIIGVVDSSYHLDEYGHEIYFYDENPSFSTKSDKRIYYSENIEMLAYLQKKLQGMNIEIYGEYRDYIKIASENKSLISFLNILIILIMGVIIIFSVIYGMIRRFQKDKEISLLTKRGLTVYRLMSINFFEQLPYIVLTYLCTLIVSLIICLILERIGVFSISYIFIIISVSVFDILLVFGFLISFSVIKSK